MEDFEEEKILGNYVEIFYDFDKVFNWKNYFVEFNI